MDVRFPRLLQVQLFCCPTKKRKKERKKSSPSQVYDANPSFFLDCHELFFFFFFFFPLLRLVSRSSALWSRSRVCRSNLRCKSIGSFFSSFFFATGLLFRFDSPFDSLRWLCHLRLFSDSLSLHRLSLFVSFLKTRTQSPHAQHLHNPGGGGALDGRKRENKKQVA